MGIIAIRRDIAAGAVFFRQVGSRLEFSLDTETWALAYDFSGLGASTQLMLSSSYQTAVSAVNTTFNSYTGNVTSIAPSLVYTASPTADFNRDKLLCWTLALWLDLLQTGENFGPQAQWANSLGQSLSQLGVDLAAGAVGTAVLAGWTGAGLAVAGAEALIALGAAFLGFIFQNVDPLISRAHWNANAVANVQCCIYDSLKGATPTATAFAAALDPDECDFAGPDTDERKILDDIAELMDSRETYLTFLALAEAASDNGIVTGGIDCPCDDRWSHDIVFNGAAMPAGLTVNSLGTFTFIPFLGLRSTVRSQPNFALGASFSMIGLRAEYGMITGAGSTTPYFRTQWNGVTPPQFLNYETSATGTVIFEEIKATAMAVTGAFTMDFRPSTLGSGEAILRKLTIYGQGANPFD